MKAIKNILVTTDFSDHSLAGLEYALGLTAQFRANITLLYVVEKKKNTGSRDGIAAASIEMQQFVAENTDEFICLGQVVVEGDPAMEIVRYAGEHSFDMIVIATPGLTGIRHIVLGSIAEKVIRLSYVPVLMVKPTVICEHILSEQDVSHDLHIPSPERK